MVVTTLGRLCEHGPLGPVWFRFGHPAWQTLPDALDNPDDERLRPPPTSARAAP
ncbi:hypothetical protein [Streptomyces sp. NPDC048248]|uniref:hypothetical protein n=1 Tax=Streptomyces sp. NPDC048248 TaxID=3365523 RepID=UPI00371BC617